MRILGVRLFIRKIFNFHFWSPQKPFSGDMTTTAAQLILKSSERIANLSWMIVQFLNRRRTWIADKVGRNFYMIRYVIETRSNFVLYDLEVLLYIGRYLIRWVKHLHTKFVWYQIYLSKKVTCTCTRNLGFPPVKKITLHNLILCICHPLLQKKNGAFSSLGHLYLVFVLLRGYNGCKTIENMRFFKIARFQVPKNGTLSAQI